MYSPRRFGEAVTPPKVLGVEMCAVHDEAANRDVQWAADFASVCVVLDPDCICEVFTDTDTWTAYVGHQQVAADAGLADCIAAIERELLAIKSAIPDAPTTGGDDGQD